jgi:hypothetical protein
MRFVLTLVTALVLAVQPAHAQGAQTTWSGLGLQVEDGGAAETWPVELTLYANGGGRIEYPTLQCGGDLIRERVRGPIVFYREDITHGENCVDNGTVGVTHQAGKLIWFWTGERTEFPSINASAVLSSVVPTS